MISRHDNVTKARNSHSEKYLILFIVVDRAHVILSLDSDLLTAGRKCPGTLNSREFARKRPRGKLRSKMARLYAVESTAYHTGAMADHRLRMPGRFGN